MTAEAPFPEVMGDIKMHVVVCVKAVADRLPDLGPSGQEDGTEGLHMNEWDSVAVETALQMRAKEKDLRITALCAGPPSWDGVLRRAVGMGVDAALRVDYASESADPSAGARALAAGMAQLNPDLILCGAMGEDGMQAATGPMLAAALMLPFCTMAMSMDREAGGLRVSCEDEGGKRRIYFLPLPCLITVQTGIYPPRYPRLSLMLKADRMEIPVLAFSRTKALPRLRLAYFESPPPSRRVYMLTGSAEEKARELVALLDQRGWLDLGKLEEGP
jgi:electron transfer flavoprotein beta subunit